MKIYFYLFSLFLFASFECHAVQCARVFDSFMERVGFQRGDASVKRAERSMSIALKELNNPELSVRSVVNLTEGRFFGDGELFFFPRISPDIKRGEPEYLSIYMPSKNRREKGNLVLLLRIESQEVRGLIYEHFIHWPSDAKDANISPDILKKMFNTLYKGVYGESLEWMIANDVIFKNIDQYVHQYGAVAEPGNMYHAFKLNELLFKDKKDGLKLLINQSLTESAVADSVPSTRPQMLDIPSNKMPRNMRSAALRSYTVEKLRELSPEEIRSLEFKDFIELFDTPEKIQSLDTSVLSADVVVKLLTEHRDWRESITLEQFQKLDVSGDGFQHVLVPHFKYYTSLAAAPGRRIINIDNLTDQQIMSLNRDIFLKDVFLAGVINNTLIPFDLIEFIAVRRNRVREIGLDTVMKEELPKEMHDLIVRLLHYPFNRPIDPKEIHDLIERQLESDPAFESMTAEQRRELFKMEMDLMVDNPQELKIVNASRRAGIVRAVIEENERGQHNWF